MGFEIITIVFLSVLTICAYFICKSLDKDFQWFETNSKIAENKINELHNELSKIPKLESEKHE